MYGMLYKIVTKPGTKAAVVEFLRWDAAVAKAAEPGTRRFDVWQMPSESDALYVYEAYTDHEAFKKHQENAPYKRYADYIERELLEAHLKVDLFPFTESLVSNEDTMWHGDGER